jgi:hypothetical protein
MPGSPTTPTLDRVRPLAFWTRLGPQVVRDSTARGRRGHRTGAPGGPSISGVPSPETGESTVLPSGISMRTGPCTSTGPHATTRTVRRWVLPAACPPGSPLFAPRDSHGATGRCVPTIASVPRALGRTESIAGQQHQRPGWRTATMPGTAQPRTIRTGPPTWCHRPQQLQRPVAQRIQNLTPVIGAETRRRSESPQYRRAGPPAYRADCRQRRQRPGAQRVR